MCLEVKLINLTVASGNGVGLHLRRLPTCERKECGGTWNPSLCFYLLMLQMQFYFRPHYSASCHTRYWWNILLLFDIYLNIANLEPRSLS